MFDFIVTKRKSGKYTVPNALPEQGRLGRPRNMLGTVFTRLSQGLAGSAKVLYKSVPQADLESYYEEKILQDPSPHNDAKILDSNFPGLTGMHARLSEAQQVESEVPPAVLIASSHQRDFSGSTLTSSPPDTAPTSPTSPSKEAPIAVKAEFEQGNTQHFSTSQAYELRALPELAELEARNDELAHFKDDPASKLQSSEQRVKDLEFSLNVANENFAKQILTSKPSILALQGEVDSLSKSVDHHKELARRAQSTLKSQTATYELRLRDQEEYYQQSLSTPKTLNDERFYEEIKANLQKKFEKRRVEESKRQQEEKDRLNKRLDDLRAKSEKLVTHYAHLGLDSLYFLVGFEAAFANEGLSNGSAEYDEFKANARRDLVFFKRGEDDDDLFYGEEEEDEEEAEAEENLVECGSDLAEAESSGQRTIEWRPDDIAEDVDMNFVRSTADLDLQLQAEEAKDLAAVAMLEMRAKKNNVEGEPSNLTITDTQFFKTSICSAPPTITPAVFKEECYVGERQKGLDPLNKPKSTWTIFDPEDVLDVLKATLKARNNDCDQDSRSAQGHDDEVLARKLQAQEYRISGVLYHQAMPMQESASVLVPPIIEAQDENSLAGTPRSVTTPALSALPNYSDAEMIRKRAENVAYKVRKTSEELAAPLADSSMQHLSSQMAARNGESSSQEDFQGWNNDSRSRGSTTFDRHFLYHAVYLGRHNESFFGGEGIGCEADVEVNARAESIEAAVDHIAHAEIEGPKGTTSNMADDNAMTETPTSTSPDVEQADRESLNNDDFSKLRAGNGSIPLAAHSNIMTEPDSFKGRTIRKPAVTKGRLQSSQPRSTDKSTSGLLEAEESERTVSNTEEANAGEVCRNNNVDTTSCTDTPKLNLNVTAFADTSLEATFTTPPSTISPIPQELLPMPKEPRTKSGKTRAQVEAEVAVALALRRLEQEKNTLTERAMDDDGTVGQEQERKQKKKNEAASSAPRKTKAERRAAAIEASKEQGAPKKKDGKSKSQSKFEEAEEQRNQKQDEDEDESQDEAVREIGYDV